MDSPRSWVVAAACSWINVFTFALIRSSAVVYVALLRTFPVSRERASWPVNLALVSYFLTGPIAGVLARYIPIWKLSMVGCLGASLAVGACFFAPSMLFLDIFIGFIHGTSVGLLSLFSIVVNQHFVKYRAVASGIANAGFTVGGFVFPPVVQAVEEKYGIHGTFLIVGAIILNSVVGALLQRTPPHAQENEDERGALTHDSDKRKAITEREDRSLRTHESSDSPQTLHDTRPCGCNGTVDQCSQMMHNLASDVHDIEIHNKEEAMNASSTGDSECAKDDVYISEEKRALSDSVRLNEVQRRPRNGGLMRPNGEHFLTFLSLPEYYVITFSFTVIHFNMATYTTVAVDFAVDRGISAWSGVYLVSVYAVSDLLARLGSGWITDRKYLRKSTMMCSHLALWGASLCLMPLCSSYPSLMVLSVLLGWCNGSTIILVVVLVMELVGLDKVGVCFGCANAVAGLAGLARPLLIGFFRDNHGDYAGLFRVTGGATMCVSLLWLCYRLREGCTSMTKYTKSPRTSSKLNNCARTL
ncbi:monocarboxylate transporter 5 [Rhipicephalus microplus]|uniref:monocarboxylate transporter 5 n=1 Tax=Rhipicephalus microplus TaxID=6941 RepID=UPI003F6D922E